MMRPPRRHGHLSRTLAVGLALAAVVLASPPVSAATVPEGFVDRHVVGGLTRPTAMALAPDGRVFVAQQGGALRVIKNGALLSAPFVKLNVDAQGERGLLGIAFDPNFATNNYVYVYYTAKSPTVHNRISRFTADGDVAVSGSEEVLLELDPLSSAVNHNGGDIRFGNDGKLYVAVGDNGSGVNAQALTNLKGKLLRINKDGTIPQDNPFYTSASGKNRAIWALGLRNPFTFTVKRSSGAIYVNDVGQEAWEEVNLGVAGANYGWPATEGYTDDPRYTSPVYAYSHTSGTVTGCAITGGAFYDPVDPVFPAEYAGDYFFADYCAGWIKRYDHGTGSVTAFAAGISSPVDLEVSPNGRLFYLARGSGSVHVITFSPEAPPSIVEHPRDQAVRVGESATFEVVASGSGPLSYQWQRNGVNIPGATAATYTLASATQADDGARFSALVSNSFGSTTSDPATLSVVTGEPPTAAITKPAAGTRYTAGKTISFSGTASDAEDGDLPASRFTWWVDFHHADHTHPFLDRQTGFKSGSFTVPKTGETSTDVWYRIHLEVRDSSGLVARASRDVLPIVSTMSFATSPAGLQVSLDGTPTVTPFSKESVVGLNRWIGAVSPQPANSRTYVFDSWSDGGSAAHTVSTPAAPTTYTAVYRPQGGSVGTGNGLSATYFDNANFTGTTVRRTDQTVNFDWAHGRPATGISPDTFSVRWTGRLQAQFGESYTLCVRSDQGARLWLDGVKVIDHWTAHTSAERCAVRSFAAGTLHTIRLDYYENSGPAVATLLWSSASTAKQVVPRSQLYPQ